MNGATVFELHKSWGFSASILDLLTAGKTFNIIALAALTAKLALLDSVLLQQAASENPGLGDRANSTVRVPILRSIPNNYTGVWEAKGYVGQFSRDFSQTLYGYTTVGDLIYPDFLDAGFGDPSFDHRCDGDCYTQVEGFGWDMSCVMANDDFTTYNVTKDMAINTTIAWENDDIVDVNKTLYHLLSVTAAQQLVGIDPGASDYSYIQLNVSWADIKPAYGGVDNKDAVNCTAQMLKQICKLRPARVLYPIEITKSKDDSVQTRSNGFQITSPWWLEDPETEDNTDPSSKDFGKLKGNQINGVRSLEPLQYDAAFDSNIQSFASMFASIFSGNVYLEYLNDTGYIAVPDGTAAIGTWWTPITTILE